MMLKHIYMQAWILNTGQKWNEMSLLFKMDIDKF